MSGEASGSAGSAGPPRHEDERGNGGPATKVRVGEGGESIMREVAAHYNNLDEGGKDKRKDSRIFFMRNFNNWIKSVLYNETMAKMKTVGDRRRFTVFDLACGKGGDLLKWKKSNTGHLVGVDIAETSIEQAKERYNIMAEKSKPFSAEFYAMDCTKGRTRDLYSDPNIQFDLVSCQFAFHYCFESLPQAERMFANVAENLRVGGYFVGTIPCADEIMSRRRRAAESPSPESTGKSFGNSVYRITFDDPSADNVDWVPSLFGCKYLFYLDGCVDCPEYLVYFPLMEKLAAQHGLKLVLKQRFSDYYKENKDKHQYKDLLTRMKALETYPNTNLVGSEDQYSSVKSKLDASGERACGTLSKHEWEALTVYTVFAFEKTHQPDS